MKTTLTGKAWIYGDNVDTDVIIPARYLVTSDEKSLAAHCMEDLDDSFAKGVIVGDVIAAGNNFGCGSSREHAPIAIKGSGTSCVIAKSFARIFYRNAINIGLPILECAETDRIAKGDLLEIDLTKGTITNRTKGETYHAKPFPEFLRSLIGLGGLVPYVRARLSE
ncbi:MAG: 3-isopropylmalate dehydratase small subunit [Synergistaceae bacterium]|nr:3-isopropylmalate dehydratase small subunit [Synergistaceae bacterium]